MVMLSRNRATMPSARLTCPATRRAIRKRAAADKLKKKQLTNLPASK